MPSTAELPPGQQLVAADKWPIVGERAPAASREPWSVSITGCVERPRCWSLEQLHALPQTTLAVDVHCVTRWSKPAMTFGGVALAVLLQEALPTAEAKFVSFRARSSHQHSTSLTRVDARQLQPLIALAHDGKPLPEAHGGPVRVVTPGRYFYKSLKWLEQIELLPEDRLGTWEREAGYHNGADPWREQRYMAPNLSKQRVAQLVASRDFRGLDLRGLDAGGRDLERLQAQGAKLRDADFRRSRLGEARFDQANLSNARFEAADLHDASFAGADVEGADFTAADLRGADFRGASFLGVSFTPDPQAAGRLVQIDERTQFDEKAVYEQLVPAQAHFLAAVLAACRRYP